MAVVDNPSKTGPLILLKFRLLLIYGCEAGTLAFQLATVQGILASLNLAHCWFGLGFLTFCQLGLGCLSPWHLDTLDEVNSAAVLSSVFHWPPSNTAPGQLPSSRGHLNLKNWPGTALLCLLLCSTVHYSVEVSGVASSHCASEGLSHLSHLSHQSGLREKVLFATSSMQVSLSLLSPGALIFTSDSCWVFPFIFFITLLYFSNWISNITEAVSLLFTIPPSCSFPQRPFLTTRQCSSTHSGMETTQSNEPTNVPETIYSRQTSDKVASFGIALPVCTVTTYLWDKRQQYNLQGDLKILGLDKPRIHMRSHVLLGGNPV